MELKMLQVRRKKRRLRRSCVELRRSLAMLRGQITSRSHHCEGCVGRGWMKGESLVVVVVASEMEEAKAA